LQLELEHRAEQEELKTLLFDLKSQCKVGAKEAMVSEEIKAIKRNPTTLCWDKTKNSLRSSQKLARAHSKQAQGCKRQNFFGRLP
jgi:hypothetical protein